MDRDKLRKRYLQDEWPVQVGNLASTLARLGSRAEDARYDQIVADLTARGNVADGVVCAQRPYRHRGRPGNDATGTRLVASNVAQ